MNRADIDEIYHRNFRLAIRALRSKGVRVTDLPDGALSALAIKMTRREVQPRNAEAYADWRNQLHPDERRQRSRAANARRAASPS